MAETGEQDWLETNRRLWDEMAVIHPSTALYDVEELVAGGDHLRPWEDDELGPVDGLDLLHLQCHIGTDTIAWARRGARVVGLDFSTEAITAARQLSARCGLDVEWIQANVYDAVTAVGARTFDVVYTGIGALGWLPDLATWAQIVRGLLKPGGVLYLVELHPMWVAMIEDGTTICQDALGAAYTRWDEPDRASYADPNRPLSSVSSFERLHAISEVLTAVLDAGMTIELFHEFDVTPAPTPWLKPRGGRLYGLPVGKPRFPLTYSLCRAAVEMTAPMRSAMSAAVRSRLSARAGRCCAGALFRQDSGRMRPVHSRIIALMVFLSLAVLMFPHQCVMRCNGDCQETCWTVWGFRLPSGPIGSLLWLLAPLAATGTYRALEHRRRRGPGRLGHVRACMPSVPAG